MRGVLGIGAVVAAVAYAVYLVVQNSATVEVHLLFASLDQVPVWALLLGSFLLGVVATGLACAWPLLRLRLDVRRQSRRITRLEQEVHGLRTLPLSPDEPVASPRVGEG